jgi:hypothetical protein
MPVFVICRDRVSSLLTLLDWLERVHLQSVYLVDNDSSYPPMLDFYATTPHRVIRLERNVGHLAPWAAGIVDRLAPDRPYIVTDPDVVPTETCPADTPQRLLEHLQAHPDSVKVGLGLKIDDIPDHYVHKKYVQAWEGQFWEHEIEPGLFRAAIDTTFALYRPGQSFAKRPALRTGPPYVARHLPWYVAAGELTEEERYYRAHASRSINSWNQKALPPKLDGYFHRSSWARIRRRVRSYRMGDA